MTFFLQLGIALWKNLTLKKRRPYVTLFELIIPLALFIILLLIRQNPRQQPQKRPIAGFRGYPLPSSGIIPIMQGFCTIRNHYDHNGLPLYPNSTIKSFLENLQHVAEDNNFFAPPFTPQDIDGLPGLYRSIIEDPAAVHDVFLRAKDIKVETVFVNQSVLEDILIHNFSLSAEQVDVLYNSKINFTEVYRVLFNSSTPIEYPAQYSSFTRHKRDLSDYTDGSNFLPHPNIPKPKRIISDNAASVLNSSAQNALSTGNLVISNVVNNNLSSLSGLKDQVNNHGDGSLTEHGKNLSDSVLHWFDDNPYKDMLPDPGQIISGASGQSSNGLIYKIIAQDPSLLLDPEVQDVIRQFTGFGGQTGMDPYELADVLKKVVMSPVGLQYITCSNQELSRILIPPQHNDTQVLTSIADSLCNMTMAQWTDLSTVLIEYSSTKAIVKQLHIEHLNVTSTTIKARQFLNNLKEFIVFEDMITRLSSFAINLPQNKCDSKLVNETSDNSTVYNHDGSDDYEHGINRNGSSGASSTTLAYDKDKNEDKKEKDEDKKEKPKPNAYSAFLQVWMTMQHVLCGETIVSQERLDKYSSTGNPRDLGFNHEEMTGISILFQLLYHNPKVLYSPNVTAVRDIISKANETFAIVGSISEYAHHWLNVSSELRDYLSEPKTEQDLEAIREMQTELKEMPAFSAIIQSKELKQFIQNTTVFNATYLLAQLDIIDNAACSWLTLVRGINLDVFKGFSTEGEVVDYFLNNAYADGVTVFASVVFTNIQGNDSIPPHVEYKIRQNASLTQKTTLIRDRFWFPGPNNKHYDYYTFGFVWVQEVIERAIIAVHTGREVTDPGTWVHEMPYPCYIKDTFLFMIEHVMPLVLVVSWVYSVAMLTQSVVYEKEQRLREVMRMMGLQSSVHWLAWFITSFTQMSITMAIITVILKFGGILSRSNPVIVFLLLEAFVVATIAFAFLITSFCSKAKVAAACAGIFYFISYVPYMYVAITEEAAFVKVPSFAKTIASLSSTTAFGLGAKYFAFYEIEGVGVQWGNINISPVEGDSYNLMYVIIMMLIDAFIYGLLTWYIENVHPGSYGLPKPWYFPFTYNYWRGFSLRTEPEQCSMSAFCPPWRRGGGLSVMEEDQACALADTTNPASFEPEPTHLKVGVCVDNLTKVYKNGKLAVKNLSYNFYEGQITSFLGHNGAGKTTTMSILTGMFPPTSGYATISGYDIRTDMDEIRRSLGMCPQHNVLFDKLTVEEHLWFYSRMKGMHGKAIAAEMHQMISDIGLSHKRHTRVDCLSGGMQRKLSVGIAFIAGSKTVILDEPTAGVDVDSRRQIWNLLLKYKKGRTIILSTHHMDEADVLGDRIAVIANGQLSCSGSSLFLKSFYGEGYHLIVVKKSSVEDDSEASNRAAKRKEQVCSPSFRTKCQEEQVTDFINKYVSTAYLKSESSWELHYILPFEEAKKGNFEKLFKQLDTSLADLQLSSYGIMDTSLEEVFLKVTEKSQTPVEQENEKNIEKELIDLGQEHKDISSGSPDSGVDVMNPSETSTPQQRQQQEIQESHYLVNEVSPPPLPQTYNTHTNNRECNSILDSPNPATMDSDSLDLDNLVLSRVSEANSFDSPLGSMSGRNNVDWDPLNIQSPLLLGSNAGIQQQPLLDVAAPPTLVPVPTLPKSIPKRLYQKHTRSPSADQVPMGASSKPDPQFSPQRKTPSDDSRIGLNSNSQLHANINQTATNTSNIGSNKKPTSRGHYRSPSDISLRTLAAIRGTYYTHRRSGSSVSTCANSHSVFKPTHQRSFSDAREQPLVLPLPNQQQQFSSSTSNLISSSGSNVEDVGESNRRSRQSINDDVEPIDLSDNIHEMSPNFGTFAKLENQDDHSLLSAEEVASLQSEGRGTYTLTGPWLILQQFIAIMVKRFFYIKRNRKQLFSQILLPAVFVCIAMTVALTAPQAKDLPPLVLSPSMYFNYTQPEGQYVPYLDKGEYDDSKTGDAKPSDLINTFHMASGLGATCVLKTPFNSTFDSDILHVINHTRKDYQLLAQYFQPQCRNVFVPGLQLKNFVPPPPTPPPTLTPLFNYTTDPNATTSTTPSHPQEPIIPRYYPKCHCDKDNTGFICEQSGFEHPPQFKVVTSDILQDITGNYEEQFLVSTTDMYRLHRYGSFEFGINKADVPANFGENAPSAFRKLAVRAVAKVRYNHKGFHSIPTFLNTLSNAILRANLPPEKGNPAAYGITAINHPMSMTNNDFSRDKLNQGSDVLIAIFIICAMSFVPASFVVFLVYEKSIKAKHLQSVCGLYKMVYWVANYIWDMCNYLIPSMCCILILKGFDIPAYVSSMNFPAVISLFLFYGWSITPMMYPVSFIFDEPSTAYICMIVANLFIGITCILTSFLLELFQQNDPGLGQIHDVLKNIFLLFPNYCLGRGLMDIAFNEYKNEYYYKAGFFDHITSPFKWEIMGRNLVAMATMGVIFFILTLLIEFNFFCKRRLGTRSVQQPVSPLTEDEDVATERKRVLRGADDVLTIENLTKVYSKRNLGKHLAVDRLCLGVAKGECFGLLGVNGAGKTTTFKMLTGDIMPTAGNAYLNGYSVLDDLSKVQQSVGYCPQFDALYDELTAREHLQLYARLKGVPYNEQKKVVDWALTKLCLTQYADIQSGSYSGGNKRKLSTAIALIGHPPVIFMDEPTTGMDPHSRRFLWDVILDLIQEGRSVILTSHSMEECEALCTRLAIMVNGQFKCLGSIQHLKDRFGDGYTVSVCVKGPDYEREVSAVQRYIERHFPEASHKGTHHNIVQYTLPTASLSLEKVFARMEEAQRDLYIEDYSISQNTLENVFINFAEEQRELISAATASGEATSNIDQQSTTRSQRGQRRSSHLNINTDENADEEAGLFVAGASSVDLDLDTNDDDFVTFDTHSNPGTRLQLLNLDHHSRCYQC